MIVSGSHFIIRFLLCLLSHPLISLQLKCYLQLNSGNIIMNTKLVRIWVKTVTNYSEALSQQLSGGIEENCKISVKWRGSQLRFKPGTSWTLGLTTNYYANHQMALIWLLFICIWKRIYSNVPCKCFLKDSR